MSPFFRGSRDKETLSSPEPKEQNKWFPARWNTELGSFAGLARKDEIGGYDFSVQLPEVVRQYPESVHFGYRESHGGGDYLVSYRSGETSWELLKINMNSSSNEIRSITRFGAHIGDRGIEDHVQFDQIQNKPPVDL